MNNPVKKTDFKLKFLGTSAQEVTGSMYLIETKEHKILFDCGLYQSGSNIRKNYDMNNRPLQVKYSAIDYIFISHCNVDHCGLLPRLYKNGCTAKIIVPTGSRNLLQQMLLDSVKIMISESKMYNKKNKKNAINPIYSLHDVMETMKHVHEYGFNKKYKLEDDLNFTYFHAGHIVRSAQIYLEITSNNHTKRFGYTGDIGSRKDKPYISLRDNLPYCDYLIGECTYASIESSKKPSVRTERTMLRNAITETCINNNGKLLLGVFSLDRLQNVLTLLYEMYGEDKTFSTPIVIDAPLGIAITNYYDKLIEKDQKLWEKVKEWGNIVWITDIKKSGYYRGIKTPQIILSTSNMLNQGRILEWVKKLLPEEKNYIGFCGFNKTNALPSQIKDKKSFPQVRIGSDFVENKCKIVNYRTFSSHADRDELMSYYLQLGFGQLFLVHSADKEEFAKTLKINLGKECKTPQIICPELEQTIYIK